MMMVTDANQSPKKASQIAEELEETPETIRELIEKL